MGFGWCWIVGIVALVVIVKLVVKFVNKNDNPK
jgi:hypothetical protein